MFETVILHADEAEADPIVGIIFVLAVVAIIVYFRFLSKNGVRFCSSCSNHSDPDARYCRECGAEMGEIEHLTIPEIEERRVRSDE